MGFVLHVKKFGVRVLESRVLEVGGDAEGHCTNDVQSRQIKVQTQEVNETKSIGRSSMLGKHFVGCAGDLAHTKSHTHTVLFTVCDLCEVRKSCEAEREVSHVTQYLTFFSLPIQARVAVWPIQTLAGIVWPCTPASPLGRH